MNEKKIYNLFPVPIFHYKLENYKEINEELINYILKLKKKDEIGNNRSNVGGWHSPNFDLVKEETPIHFINKFKDFLKNIIINEFGWEYLPNKQRIVAMWAIINKKNSRKMFRWKLDKKIVGVSTVLNELGSHACHLASYMSGLKTKKVFADISQVSKTVKMDNNAKVLIEFNNGAKGMFWTSCTARGGVYGLRIRIFGSKGSLEWVQNDPTYLKFNPSKGAVRILERGFHDASFSKKFSRIKFGHPEGYLDAFSNIYREFAESLKSKKRTFYPNEDDGYETAKFINACKKSSKSKKWVKL